MTGQVGPRLPSFSTKALPERSGDPRPPLRPLPPTPGQSAPAGLQRTSAPVPVAPDGGRHGMFFYDAAARPLAWTREGFVSAPYPTVFRGKFGEPLQIGHVISPGDFSATAWQVDAVRHQPALTGRLGSAQHVMVSKYMKSAP